MAAEPLLGNGVQEADDSVDRARYVAIRQVIRALAVRQARLDAREERADNDNSLNQSDGKGVSDDASL